MFSCLLLFPRKASLAYNKQILRCYAVANWHMMDKQLTQCFFFCVSARLLPEKLTVYTTLVGLLNARNYNFGGEFVEAMIRQLKECLKVNMYNEAVHLVSGVLFIYLFHFLFLSSSFHLFVTEELDFAICVTVSFAADVQCTVNIPRGNVCYVRSIFFFRGEESYYICKIYFQLYLFHSEKLNLR